MPGIRRRTVTYNKDSKFLTYTRNCEQKATIGIVKSTLEIPPRHNGVMPIEIKGHTIKGHMAYFISNEDSTKGKGSQYQHHKWHTQHQRKNICQYSGVKLYK